MFLIRIFLNRNTIVKDTKKGVMIMAEGKYYWLKLKKDFFKRHDIRIIESMPNGKEYILFYLKLLLESIDHEGKLRFNETVPYNEHMLSIITNTNIDIVKSAIDMFKQLEMIDIYSDKTIYMAEVEKLIGSESRWAEKKRTQRAKKDNVPLLSPKCPTEIEIDKELKIDIETEKEIETEEEGKKPQKRFKKPTLEEVQAYCKERNNNVDAKAFFDYYETGDWKDAKGKPVRNWKQKVITWERSSDNGKSKPKPKPTFDYDQFAE
jgi:predicted phage replisome organizer